MQVRGRMQKGMVADITIFDPETVTDNSTYEKGTLPSTGIPHVLVNGILVMKDQEPLKGVNPGQPIRFEPVESRFEPLSQKSGRKPTMPPRSILVAACLVHSPTCINIIPENL